MLDPMPPPIVGFIHAATVHNWRDIVHEQLSLMRRSGLYQKSARIHLGLVGPEWDEDFCDGKCAVAARCSDLSAFEFPTLVALYQQCLAADCLVYYVHTKGVVSGQHIPHIHDWRRYMEHFIIARHEQCIAALETHDLCGVEWRECPPWPLFGGNFWWARSDYIRRLPSPSQWRDALVRFTGTSGLSARHWAERWVGSATAVRASCLHRAGVDLYRYPYPSEAYTDDPNAHIVPIESESWKCPSAWRGLENRFQRHLRRVGTIRTVVEVGVEYGFSLFSLAAAMPWAQVIGIDPYRRQAPDDVRRLAALGEQAVIGNAEAEDWVDSHSPAFPNIRLLKTTSQHGAQLVGGPLDVIHIDAAHTYADVARDFCAWAPKLRPGGCIMFHDTMSYPQDVGRFFRELSGEKAHIALCHGLGFWYKSAEHQQTSPA